MREQVSRVAVGPRAEAEGKRHGAEAGEGAQVLVSDVLDAPLPRLQAVAGGPPSGGGRRQRVQPADAGAASRRRAWLLPRHVGDAGADGGAHVLAGDGPGRLHHQVGDGENQEKASYHPPHPPLSLAGFSSYAKLCSLVLQHRRKERVSYRLISAV